MLTLRGVRPDGTPVELSQPQRAARCLSLPARRHGPRVHLSFQNSQDFALLDLKTKKSRPLASLEDLRSVDDLRHHARRQVHRLRLFARELEHRAVRAAGEVTPRKSARDYRPKFSLAPNITRRGSTKSDPCPKVD